MKSAFVWEFAHDRERARDFLVYGRLNVCGRTGQSLEDHVVRVGRKIEFDASTDLDGRREGTEGVGEHRYDGRLIAWTRGVVIAAASDQCNRRDQEYCSFHVASSCGA